MTGKTEANHYDLLAAGNYDYTLQDGTHTLTIDRHDLNLNITAERQYGDISNQQYVSDYKSDAKPSGTTLSYATGVTSDTNGLQNGETIDFTKSTVALSDNFAQADAGTYTHNGIMTTRIRVQIIPSAIRVSPVSRLRQATAQHSIPRTTTSTTRPPIRLTRQTSTTPTTASAITARITPRQRIPIRLSARTRIPQRKASAAI